MFRVSGLLRRCARLLVLVLAFLFPDRVVPCVRTLMAMSTALLPLKESTRLICFALLDGLLFYCLSRASTVLAELYFDSGPCCVGQLRCLAIFRDLFHLKLERWEVSFVLKLFLGGKLLCILAASLPPYIPFWSGNLGYKDQMLVATIRWKLWYGDCSVSTNLSWSSTILIPIYNHHS